MATAALSEPHVLAHAKRRLSPGPGEPRTYAVVDTQFAKEEWLAEQSITPDVREYLPPFNPVRLGAGYLDLVGVRLPESDLQAVERVGEQPPLIAVEAKEYTEVDGSSKFVGK